MGSQYPPLMGHLTVSARSRKLGRGRYVGAYILEGVGPGGRPAFGMYTIPGEFKTADAALKAARAAGRRCAEGFERSRQVALTPVCQPTP